MRGLILLDGPDCAGKSTLAQSLIAASAEQGHKAVVHHLGKPEPGKCWKIHADALLAYIKQMLDEDVIVIADRHFLSEGIYGRGYRSGSEYPYTMRYMDMLFNRFNGLKVVCCPPTSVVVDTHAKMKEVRREEYDSGMDKIANMFQSIWHSAVHLTSLPGADYTAQLAALGGVQDKPLWYHFDYCENDVDDYARFLLKELEIENDIADPFLSQYRFNGTPSLRSVLLIGDKMNTPNELGIPFFANHGSSQFLAKTLHQLCVPAENLCIVNINDPGGINAVTTLIRYCGRAVVLGREAERTMRENSIEFDAYCRHPQHARRFNHHDNTYTRELGLAMGVRLCQ
jgi:nicotinamide riboside kinase